MIFFCLSEIWVGRGRYYLTIELKFYNDFVSDYSHLRGKFYTYRKAGRQAASQMSN